MVKTLVFLTVGIVAGAVLMALWQPSSTALTSVGEPLMADSAPAAVTRGELAEIGGRLEAIEARIGELATAVAALQTVPPQAAQGAQVVQLAPGATFTPVLPPSLPSPGSLPAGTVAFAATA